MIVLVIVLGIEKQTTMETTTGSMGGNNRSGRKGLIDARGYEWVD